MKAAPGEISRLLPGFERGRKDALDRLLPLVYNDLRRLARRYLNGERTGHTLQPTALVHETYVRLVEQNQVDWQNRAQFFCVAAQMMRRILVDYARARVTRKRAGNAVKLDVEGLELPANAPRMEEILAVDEALSRLAQFDPQQGRVVELRYFAGLSIEETAEALDVSPRTVTREWAMASAWVRGELGRTAHV